jgi:hypothetical protein
VYRISSLPSAERWVEGDKEIAMKKRAIQKCCGNCYYFTVEPRKKKGHCGIYYIRAWRHNSCPDNFRERAGAPRGPSDSLPDHIVGT